MTDQTDIPIDPELPEDFDDTPNDERPESHQAWWFVPYLVTGPRGYTLRCEPPLERLNFLYRASSPL